jgi:small subunit ribosomal protein S16
MLTIRLRRAGTRSRPFYRVVVSESTRTPQARVLEFLGWFDPKTSPKKLELDLARAEQWIAKGATPSETVADLIRKEQKRAAVSA